MFFAKASGKSGELYLYEEIGEGWFGGISSKTVAAELNKLRGVAKLDVFINSPGGSVFEGIAIQSLIERFDAETTVHVDGIAASIASIIMLGAPKRKIAKNGTVMIHDPWGMGVGTAEDLDKVANSLRKVRDQLVSTYVAKTGKSVDEVSAAMSAETWFTAQEALDFGLVTEIVEDKVVEANFALLARYGKTPQALRAGASDRRTRLADMDVAALQIRRTRTSK